MLRSQLMVNVASGAVTTGINIVVLAVAYPVYLHFLGYELYGVWLILGTVLAFAQMGNLQIGPAVTKFVAEEYGREDIGGVARYVLMAMVMLSATGILVLLHFGSGVFGGSLMGLLLSPFHKLMLSRCAGVATVPVYDLAYNGSMQFRSLAEAGLRALMPEISRVGANLTKKARDSINQIHQRALKYVIVFGAPAYLALFTLAVPLLKIWLRDRYVDTLPGSFRVLLVATFLSLIGVPAYYTLMGLGRVRHTFVSHVLQSLISVAVVLAVALSAALTVEGVAWAVFVGVAASTAYLLCQKRRLFQHERYGDDDHETIGR